MCSWLKIGALRDMGVDMLYTTAHAGYLQNDKENNTCSRRYLIGT